ncbi:MAG: hypothetical protein U0L77_05515, partial [Prevotellamassilia sp.]|nr:hypothetical protein [Prevotellamassilia sp.]
GSVKNLETTPILLPIILPLPRHVFKPTLYQNFLPRLVILFPRVGRKITRVGNKITRRGRKHIKHTMQSIIIMRCISP